MRKLPLAAAVAAVLLAVPASAAAAPADGRVGPSLSITGNGRLLRPAGDMVTVGNFPMAGALTPDGRGARSTPPPPGLNASREEHERALGAMRVLRHGGNAKAWLERHSADER
jgi:hypothetical protein